MERIELAQGLSFSRLVYGMWRLADDSDTSVRHVDAKINAALDQGITTFDQADIYGGYTAEAVMGTAMKANPSLRQRMEIVSKCDIVIDAGRHSGARVKHYNTTAAHINASVDASLSEMSVDEIDVLLIHGQTRSWTIMKQVRRWMRWWMREKSARWESLTLDPGTGIYSSRPCAIRL